MNYVVVLHKLHIKDDGGLCIVDSFITTYNLKGFIINNF